MTTEEFDLFLGTGFLVKEFISSTSEYHAEEYDDDRDEFSGELDHTELHPDQKETVYTVTHRDGCVIKQGLSKDQLIKYVKQTLY